MGSRKLTQCGRLKNTLTAGYREVFNTQTQMEAVPKHWQDLPREYGSPTTVRWRLKQCGEKGISEHIWRAALAALDRRGALDWTMSFHRENSSDPRIPKASQLSRSAGRGEPQRKGKAGAHAPACDVLGCEEGQSKPEGRSLPRRAIHPDDTPMPLDDLAIDVEP
jgi:hypothetical protein